MTGTEGFLQQREADLKGRRQLTALNEIEAEFTNIRDGWIQAVKRKNLAAVNAMIEGLYWFCMMRSRFQEGYELFGLARKQFAPQSGDEINPVYGRLLVRYSDPTQDAKTTLERGLAVARINNDQREIAFCLHALGNLAEMDEQKLSFFGESLTSYRALDDRFYQARVLNDIGMQHLFMERHEDALKALQQSLELRQSIGDTLGTVTSLFMLGHYTYMTNKRVDGENRDYYAEANALARETGKLYELAESNIVLGVRAFGQDKGKARKLAEEALKIATDINVPIIRGRALALLGSIASYEGDYAMGEQFCTESLLIAAANPSDVTLSLFASAAMGQVACGLEKYETAWEHVKTVFDIGVTHNLRHFAAGSLDVAASVLAHKGQKERAVELLGLMSVLFGAPDAQQEDGQEWPLLTQLEAELGHTRYAAAWTRGKSMRLDAVVKERLA